MITPVKPADIIKDKYCETFDVVQRYEMIDAMWGLSHIQITDEDIKALKEGKFLYSSDGEYAQIISYKGENE